MENAVLRAAQGNHEAYQYVKEIIIRYIKRKIKEEKYTNYLDMTEELFVKTGLYALQRTLTSIKNPEGIKNEHYQEIYRNVNREMISLIKLRYRKSPDAWEKRIKRLGTIEI